MMDPAFQLDVDMKGGSGGRTVVIAFCMVTKNMVEVVRRKREGRERQKEKGVIPKESQGNSWNTKEHCGRR